MLKPVKVSLIKIKHQESVMKNTLIIKTAAAAPVSAGVVFSAGFRQRRYYCYDRLL